MKIGQLVIRRVRIWSPATCESALYVNPISTGLQKSRVPLGVGEGWNPFTCL